MRGSLGKKWILASTFALLTLTLTLWSVPTVGAQMVTHTAPIRKGAAAATNYAGLVNSMIGTSAEPSSPGGSGDDFPGADAPFGMVQWSPDTVNSFDGGYDYSDNRIRGFSLTHLSGAGCNTYGDIPFMPYVGAVTSSPASSPSQYVSTFSHSNEHVAAGYYSVALANGVTTQLTTTTRSGAGSFTYPTGQTATLLLNVSGSANGVSAAQATISGGNTISGSATSGHFCGAGDQYTVYFWAQFSQSFASSGTWNGSTVTAGASSVSGTSSGVYATFNTSSSTTITVRVGLSYVSVANAQANVNQEIPAGTSFSTVQSQTTQTWNNFLGEIAVSGGTSDQQVIFYTSLYHSLLQPNVVSDINGQYMGFDKQVHSVASGHAQYANYSGWDIYRSDAQLMAFLAPAQASDIAQSMVNDYAQSGLLPKWSTINAETYVMVGDPGTAILADLYAFGATNFDTATALTDMVRQATVTNNDRPGLNYLESLGYLPENGSYGCCNFYGSAATTLEYNSADFALGAFAQALGDTADYQTFVNRAQDWQNLLNTTDKALEPRNANGSFAYQPFDPTSSNGWVEGSGAQYNWMVPFNLAGLFQAEGGNSAIVSRLNTFFSQLNSGTNTAYAFMGNEPSVESPWEYDYAGAPYQTQKVVRQVENTLYLNQAGGLAGNDDLGEMSSWYVWAALGMYPETPGVANMALTSPLFPSITVTRPGGQTITISAPNASASTYYIQSLTVNGTTSNNDWLPPSFIANGGSLNFTLSTTANTSWASAAANEPPSYGSVNASGTFSSGFESGQPQPTWTSTVDSAGQPAGGLQNVGGICCSLTGPESAVRNETTHSGSTALMYSGLDNSVTTSYAYTKIFDLTGQNITVTANTQLTYWIYPQSSATSGLVSGNNSSCVAIDLIFSDNTNLRDSGATDQNGNRAHPAYQCGTLKMDTWNLETIKLGAFVNGKTVVRIDLGYDQPANTGGYRGYIDDLAIAPAPAVFNNAGISDDTNQAAASFDNSGFSYSAQALSKAGYTPGATVTVNGIKYTWPNVASATNDNVVALGQTIQVAAKSGASQLSFLGSSTNGPTTGTITITYTDGTTQTASLGFTDWTLNGGSASLSYSNTVACTMTYRNSSSGTSQQITTDVFASTPISLNTSKQVASITLPSSVNQGVLHIFAWTIA